MSQITNALFTQKTNLRKVMKQVLKLITDENKRRQSEQVVNYLLNTHLKFNSAQHIAVYLAMKHEEIDTNLLIEHLLKDETNKENRKHIYVPHFELSSKSDEMRFFEIKDLNQYWNEMNADNKFGIRQFNNVANMSEANINKFDLVIVPGLAFDYSDSTRTKIARLGRGKGYYDSFLSKIPQCYTLGVGFNEQFLSFNENINLTLPVIQSKDYLLDEFLCEKMIN